MVQSLEVKQGANVLWEPQYQGQVENGGGGDDDDDDDDADDD